MGGRSGNQGSCAQPCRLPYTLRGKKGYLLSLRDLCLAAHIPQTLELGVSSLKDVYKRQLRLSPFFI